MGQLAGSGGGRGKKRQGMGLNWKDLEEASGLQICNVSLYALKFRAKNVLCLKEIFIPGNVTVGSVEGRREEAERKRAPSSCDSMQKPLLQPSSRVQPVH